MPNVNPFQSVAQRSAERLIQMRKQAEKSAIVPFGMQEVDSRAWRRRWDRSTPEMRRQMAETLGPDTRTRLQELAKRLTGPRADRGQVDMMPFGGE